MRRHRVQLALRFRCCVQHRLSQAHPTVWAPFRVEASASIRPVMRRPLAGVPALQSPGSCCLSAAGIRFSGRPAPARGSGPPSRLAYRHAIVCAGPGRGCHVPHETETARVGALCARRTVVRSRPATNPRAAPAAFQRPAPTSRCHIPSARVIITRHHRGSHHSPVRPSPACNHRMERQSLGLSPRASHLTVTRDARRGGDGPRALDRALHLRHLSNPFPMSAAALKQLRVTLRG
jgi:hypothetical protein